MLIYATDSDLNTWGITVPTNSAKLLRIASGWVADATGSAFYQVDSDGYPTDAPTRQALTDATCAQVETWVTLGIDPAAGPGGASGPASSKKVGTASLGYTQTSPQVQARMDAATQLCDEANRILRLAGLLASTVWTYG